MKGVRDNPGTLSSALLKMSIAVCLLVPVQYQCQERENSMMQFQLKYLILTDIWFG